ncbi:hypothetical protein EKK58_12780 [Candidatus Dependentiae bacterium]|nr:MAG: hypothetical protein EKK58_12780 [Candidatus Dependentiae bacterium]
MIPVPQIKAIDLAFGNIDHLPDMKDIPEEFNDRFDNIHCRVVSAWFFNGYSKAEAIAKITPKEGVDKVEAQRALATILRSYAPQHEHKIAGCGYLLSQWFNVEAKESEDE